MTATMVRETVTHLRPAGNGDVRVTVRVWGNGDRAWCRATVKCLPGAAWWTCPDPRTLRRLVDAAVAGTGLARHGARFAGDRRTDGWAFHYPLRTTLPPCPDCGAVLTTGATNGRPTLVCGACDWSEWVDQSGLTGGVQ